MNLRPFTMWEIFFASWNWRGLPAVWIIRFTKARELPCGLWSLWKNSHRQGCRDIAAKFVKRTPARIALLLPVCDGRRVRRGRLAGEFFENFVSDPSKKIILNNDNDEQRMLFENCTLKGKRTCNPIVDWRDSDVWEYIRSERLEINPLYDMGFYRVGCLGCPMAGKNRWTEFRLFPTYQRAYIRSFGKMLDVIHAGGGKTKWKTAEDVFSWWMEEETIKGQMSLFDITEWKNVNET